MRRPGFPQAPKQKRPTLRRVGRFKLLQFQTAYSERSADIWQQRHKARPLDRLRHHPLIHRIDARALAGQDLAVAADELAQGFGVLVIDVLLAPGRGFGRLNLRAAKGLELILLLAAFAATAAMSGSGHFSQL